MVETPIWKTSYRLLMDDKGAKLQGWAIVENQTESDWNGVSLSLVSGRPISFAMDLYQPLYSTRPVVVPDLLAQLRPQVYEGGIGTGDRVQMQLAPAPAGAGGGRGGRAGIAGGAMAADQAAKAAAAPRLEQGRLDLNYVGESVQSIAQAAKLGELFSYSIPNVTLARQKSAMLPIITDSVSVSRVSIYNAAVLPSNPLNGVRLKNTTGKHLQQGPVTVLDRGGYAGDARIDNVPPGQERLLSYGVDLELVVDNTKNTQVSSVVTARINRGTLIVDRKFVSSQDYQLDNKGDRDKTVVIEHPIKQGWKLVEPARPIETTPVLYRFQGTAAAKKVTTLTVREEMVRSETIAMLPSDVGQLLQYSRTGEIPAAVRDAITKAIQLKQAVLETERQIADRTQQVQDITTEQNRIRENMKTVSQSSQYYTRLMAKLNEQETTIEKLQVQRDDLNRKRDLQQKELDDYLAGLTIG